MKRGLERHSQKKNEMSLVVQQERQTSPVDWTDGSTEETEAT